MAVAILANRWDTAKVVISISKAQYQKEDEEQRPSQPYNDSDDSEEYDSDMSVDDYDEPISKPQLVDLAHRLSIVKTSVGPERLFTSYARILPDEKSARLGTPLTLALEDADVQVFEQILALGDMCDPPITIGPHYMANVIKSDVPALIDVVIRRFGFGLPPQLDEDENDNENESAGGEETPKKKKSSKTYLGLNVHGQKRKDLASKGDPDAPRQTVEAHIPLIWQAAQLNAPKILTWLASVAPLEAYRAYMESSKDEVSFSMKRIPNFEQKFPSLIGSVITDVGEHAVLAQLAGGSPKLETLRLLFSLYPNLKAAFVHNKLQGLKITPIHYVCENGLAPEFFDFFISQSADPVVTDHRGCNIMHIVTARGHIKLLKHMLAKLPRDQLALLLSQPNIGQQNTVSKIDSYWHISLTFYIASTSRCQLREHLCSRMFTFL